MRDADCLDTWWFGKRPYSRHRPPPQVSLALQSSFFFILCLLMPGLVNVAVVPWQKVYEDGQAASIVHLYRAESDAQDPEFSAGDDPETEAETDSLGASYKKSGTSYSSL